MSIIYAVIECLSLIKDTRASRLGLRKILLSKLPFHQEGFSEKKSHLLYLWKVERIFTTCKIEYTDCLCLDFEQSIPFLVFINWGCIHLKKKKKLLFIFFLPNLEKVKCTPTQRDMLMMLMVQKLKENFFMHEFMGWYHNYTIE